MPDENIEKQLQKFVEGKEKEEQVGPKISEAPAPKFQHQKGEEKVSLGNKLGYQKLPIKDLPTQGLFYPEDTEVAIRAATAGEVRHWSTLNEDDLNQLDDMLNYILERCVSFKTPGNYSSSWKDIKEVDRFYILLAIRELTFVKGENQLQVKTSESGKIDVTKEMIDYISIDERLMKYYDSQKRCFVLNFKDGSKIDIYIPSVGVTNFLKNYAIRKQQIGEVFDMDFLNFAPFIIKDWRGLTENTYKQMVIDSNDWTIQQISVLTHIRDLFMDTVDPVVKYTDERGTERQAPLNFLGGIKSVFLISDPFGELV